MKILAAFLLAVSLLLRTAPICAAPVQTQATATMPHCAEAAKHHDRQPAQKDDDAARACHSCVFPPPAEARLLQIEPAIVTTQISLFEQLNGSALRPPTPPPRGVDRMTFQHFNGV